jgi:hypothetical protein
LPTRNYYYFIASLPHINYGEKPPMSSLEFREQCAMLLSAGDYELTHYCRYDPRMAVETVQPTGSAFIDFHLLRERVLTLTLAWLRAGKLKRSNPGQEPPHDIPRTEAVAKNAFEMDDPLEAAIMMDRSRWGTLDEMVNVTDYFGANNVYAYLLKLQLLERRQRYDREKGFTEYRDLYDSIVNAIPRFKEDR